MLPTGQLADSTHRCPPREVAAIAWPQMMRSCRWGDLAATLDHRSVGIEKQLGVEQ
jgi:hypothetical protein